MSEAAKDAMPRAGARIRIAASRGNALILLALGAALPGMLINVTRPWGMELRELAAFAPFIMFLSAILLACGAGLALRWRPVFEADERGIAMPLGMLGLVRLPWEAVAAWGIAERRVPWLPVLNQRVFALWLHDRHAVPRLRQGEIALNRAMMGADLVLSDWFVPRGFDAIVLTCRTLRPELERRR